MALFTLSDRRVMPNQALQRTRHGVVVCNPRVPRAGPLSLCVRRRSILPTDKRGDLLRWYLSVLFVILVAGLPAKAGTGEVFDGILDRVTLRDEATGAILRVKPRADAPPDTPELACVIQKVPDGHDSQPPEKESYTVRLETVPGLLGGEYWMNNPPGVYESYILRGTTRLRTEAARWAAREKALSEKERDELVGRWVCTRGDMVSVVEFDRESMTISIDDPTYPVKSLRGGYSFPRPYPLQYKIHLDSGCGRYILDYRRHRDKIYMSGNFGFDLRSPGGKVRYLDVPLWGCWKRERK